MSTYDTFCHLADEYPAAWREPVGAWLSHLEERGRSTSTVLTYCRSLKSTVCAMREVVGDGFSPDQLLSARAETFEAFQRTLSALGMSSASVNARLSAARSFAGHYATAKGQGVGALFGTANMPIHAKPKTAARLAAAREIDGEDQMELDFGDPWIRARNCAIVRVIADTRAKTAEIGAIPCPGGEPRDWHDLTLPGDTTLAPRAAAISTETREAIGSYLDLAPFPARPGEPLFVTRHGTPISSRVVQLFFAAGVEALGLAVDINPRVVRTGLARRWHGDGVPIEDIARRLGIAGYDAVAKLIDNDRASRACRRGARSAGLDAIAELLTDYQRLPRAFMAELVTTTSLDLRTVYTYAREAEAFTIAMANQGRALADIDRSDVESFIETWERERQGPSADRLVASLRAFFSFLQATSRIATDPTALIERGKPTSAPGQASCAPFTAIEAFLDACAIRSEPRFVTTAAVVALASSLILRLEHLANIGREVIQLGAPGQGGSVVIANETYPIGRREAEALRRLLELVPPGPTRDLPSALGWRRAAGEDGRVALSSRLRQTCRELALPAMTWRSIRTAYIVEALRDGADGLVVAKRCGFVSINQIKPYQVLAATRREAANDDHQATASVA